MLAHSPKSTRQHRGASVVEFAVVAPVLLTFILGIVEIGRLVMVAQVNTNAAREASRYAAQGNANTATVDAYTRTYLSAAGINAAAAGTNSSTAVTVEYQNGAVWTATSDPSTLPAGTPVRVTVSVDFNHQSWLPARFFVGDHTQVQGVAIMRKE
jgi:Flp pilus assembly protein TadG